MAYPSSTDQNMVIVDKRQVVAVRTVDQSTYNRNQVSLTVWLAGGGVIELTHLGTIESANVIATGFASGFAGEAACHE